MEANVSKRNENEITGGGVTEIFWGSIRSNELAENKKITWVGEICCRLTKTNQPLQFTFRRKLNASFNPYAFLGTKTVNDNIDDIYRKMFIHRKPFAKPSV